MGNGSAYIPMIVIACIVFFFLFIWLSKTIYKKNVYEKEKDMMNLHMIEQEKYIKLVVEKDMDMRKFRHDVKEHMSIVYKCMEDSAYEEGKEYIRKMYEVFSDSQVTRYIGINAVCRNFLYPCTYILFLYPRKDRNRK